MLQSIHIITLCLGKRNFHTFISLENIFFYEKHHLMENQIPHQVVFSFLFTLLLMSKIIMWKFFASRSNLIYFNLSSLLRPLFPGWIVPDMPYLLERVVILYQRGNKWIETVGLLIQRVHFDEGASLYRLVIFWY